MDGLREQLAKNALNTGAIFHGYSELAGKGKWIATLNLVWPPADGVVISAFMTTAFERFKRSRIPPTAYLEIPTGSYAFLNEPTILDLASLNERRLRDVLNARLFEYCGYLTDEHLAAARIVVSKSLYVTPPHRLLVTGDKKIAV
jgi:hypothetical protein